MSLTTQFYTLISMIGMGSYFGASLDTYQFFLNRPKRSRLLVFVHDLLFWLVQALLVFYVLFLVNQGELRFYSFLALICGFAAYQALFKNIYMDALRVIISISVAVFIFIKKVCNITVVKPIVGIVKIIIYILKKLIVGLFSLVRSIIVLMMKISLFILQPFLWILSKFYKMLPNIITIKVEKLYNLSRGFFGNIKNTIYRVVENAGKKFKK